jgi:diguanylate cyclase (GGDEF)-like protein
VWSRLKAAAAKETIRRMAYFDAVTGLPNRVRLSHLLSNAIDVARGERRSLAFVRINMAYLQDLNATLGSTEVDKLVQAVASRLQQTIDDAGTLGHLAEFEFAVLLPRDLPPQRAALEELDNTNPNASNRSPVPT